MLTAIELFRPEEMRWDIDARKHVIISDSPTDIAVGFSPSFCLLKIQFLHLSRQIIFIVQSHRFVQDSLVISIS